MPDYKRIFGFDMSFRKRKNRGGFTLLETAVAVGILAVIVAFSGVIFKVSIDSYRKANANAEIMQKLRTITEQLNADFRGRRKNLKWKTTWHHGGSSTKKLRADTMAFFANGDFKSTGQYQYGTKEKTVSGNVASVFYGQLQTPDPLTWDPNEKKILTRVQTILSFEDNTALADPNVDPNDKIRCEYYKLALAEWFADTPAPLKDPNWDEWDDRPDWDPEDANDFQTLSLNYLAEGVDDFKIQYVGWDYDYPDDFKFNQWRPETENLEKDSKDKWKDRNVSIRALKFIFTLYDSKGIIKNGRTFTHIVYLGD